MSIRGFNFFTPSDGRGSETRILSRARRQAVAALFLLALPLAAQRPGGEVASIDLSAPQTALTAGRSIELRARAYNVNGATIRGAALNWSSSDGEVAQVDRRGRVTGFKPGWVEIEVRDQEAGASDRLALQVNPARIEVTPAEATVEVGDRVTLAARAFNAQNEEIAGVRFRFASSAPALAKIEGATLAALNEGTVTVSAAVDTPRPLGFGTTAIIRVQRRADYRLARLAFADQEPGAVSVLSTPRSSAAGDHVAAVVNFSNGGSALVLYTNGQPRTLAQAGQMLPAADGIISFFQNVSVNARGDVAAEVNFVTEWCSEAVVLFRAANQWRAEMASPRVCFLNLHPRALGPNGEVPWVDNGTLWLKRVGAAAEAVRRTGGSLPGIARIDNFGNWAAVTEAGTLVFEAQGNGQDKWYYRRGTAEPQALIGLLENIGGDVVRQMDGQPPLETEPDDFAIYTAGADWSGIARGKPGAWRLAARSGRDGIGWLQGWGWGRFAVRGAALYATVWHQAANADRIVRIKPGGVEIVATQGYREVEMVWAPKEGALLLGGYDPRLRAQILRATGTAQPATPFVTAGTPWSGAAAAAFQQWSISRNGAPVLRMAGDTLAQWSGAAFTPLVKPEDTGGMLLATITAFAANAEGDALAATSNGGRSGLYLRRAGKWTALAEPEVAALALPGNRRIDGVANWNNGMLALNRRGQAVAFVNASGWTQVLYTPGAAPQIIYRQNDAAPGGSTFAWPDQIALDESGRLLFQTPLTNGQRALFLWENGQVRRLLTQGQNGPEGRRVNSFSAVLAAGNRLFVRMDTGAPSQSELWELGAGDSWRIVLRAPETVLNGLSANGHSGAGFSANSRGEVAMPVGTPSGVALMVRREGVPDRVVALPHEPGPGGEWFLSIHNVSVAENGDIYFLVAVSAGGRERLALYQAVPR